MHFRSCGVTQFPQSRCGDDAGEDWGGDEGRPCDLGGVESAMHKSQCAARFKFMEVLGQVHECASFYFLLSHRSSLANRVAEAPEF